MKNSEKTAETIPLVRKPSGAETRRGLRLWELRKRRGDARAKLCLTRDASSLPSLVQTVRTLDLEIAALAANPEVRHG